MNIEIKKITIKKNVIDSGKFVLLSLKSDPINPYKSPLWKKKPPDEPGDDVTNPAAFTRTGLKSLTLEIKLSTTNAEPGSYRLNGYNALFYSHRTTLPSFYSDIFEIKKKGQETRIIEVYPSNILLFIGIYFTIPDAITWVISPTADDDPEKRQTIGQTALEIYILYDDVDFSFFRRGVPVEILRYLDVVYINQFSQHGNQYPPDEVKVETFVEYIVKTLFFRNPPRYDIYVGASHFSDLRLSDESVSITGGIFLDMYLNALKDIDSLCDCKDQAAALYAFLSAVGIGDVDICLMIPFGYMKLSLLVGREFVNNTLYKGNLEEKIVNPIRPDREGFGLHYFCAWEKNTSGSTPEETKILDACIGPHTGNEDKGQYVKAVVDTFYPHQDDEHGTAKDIYPYNAKVTMDYIPYTGGKPKTCTTKSTNNNQFFVVCDWADPRSCPVLGFDWDITYEKTFAGDIEVLKAWKLRKKGESIHINLYVNSSADSDITTDRFSSIYSCTTHPDNSPYEKGNSFLGKLAAQYCFQHTRRVFWVPHFESLGLTNVTFDVRCTNVTFNVDALLVWLNQMALTRRAFEIAPFKPSMKGITVTPKRPKVGDKVEISMVSRKNLMLDFLLLEDSGLRLIEQGAESTGDSSSILNINPEMNFYMEFLSCKESKNKLRIVAVDKDTLLCNSADKNIHIYPK